MSETPKTKPAIDPASTATGTNFVVAGHAILFREDETERCDVCGADIACFRDDDDDGLDIGGRGLLVWARGDERRYQEPPLCSSCATAIGVSALARWEIEEEEG